MNLLLDFIPFQNQHGVGGAASFTKRICDEVIANKRNDTKFYAVYDSTKPQCKMFDIYDFANKNSITLLNIADNKIGHLTKNHTIDVFFIAIAQFYAEYDLTGINCKTVMFIHDIFDIERCENRIDAAIYDKNYETKWQYAKRLTNLFSHRWDRMAKKCYGNIIPLYTASNTIACTVSEYTKNSLTYFFPTIRKKINVFYSPVKKTNRKDSIEDDILRSIINKREPYILIIAANRIYKNPSIVIKVFLRLKEEYPQLKLITLKYGRNVHKDHIDISFLSDSDLENAYKYAQALVFASFFEGFGYPPIEAMRYGTPTVASNVTSIPEILGDAGVYFSPLYPADLYRALKDVLDNKKHLSERIQKHYQHIRKRQEEDLNKLTEILLTK